MKWCALFLGLTLTALSQKTKPPDVVVSEASAHVEENLLVVDGRIKNVSLKPIKNLTVIYDVLDSDQKVLTKQKGQIDEELLEPEAEAEFHAQMARHARSVWVKLEFEDGAERELRFAATKPIPIDNQ